MSSKKNRINSQEIIESYKSNYQPSPIELPQEVEELGKLLDKIYKKENIDKLEPSKILLGALYTMKKENRENNPDWVSQSANSLREILYPYYSGKYKNILYLFRKYTIDKNLSKKIKSKDFIKVFFRINHLYMIFQDLTHHLVTPKVKNLEKLNKNPSPELFERWVREFVNYLFKAIKFQQLFIHNLIDTILERELKESIKKDIKILVQSYINLDAYNYFYAKANERWLEWLWENGFLDELKKPAKDSSRYSYSTPEIRYLVRMSKSENRLIIKKIIEIITDDNLATSKDNFNPELIDQIFSILENWSVEYVIEVFKKLKFSEKIREWIRLMSPFSITISYSLERILKKLIEAKEYEWAIKFADYILTIKNKSDFKIETIEIEKEKRIYKGKITPFYISDIDQIEVFESLKKVLDESNNIKFAEDIFDIFSNKFKEILNLVTEKDRYFFDYDDNELISMYTIDIFSLDISEKNDFDYHIKGFLYILNQSWIKIVQYYQEKNSNKIKEIFEKNIGYEDDKKASIKKSARSIWAFRLYALSQAPYIFEKEIKEMLFKPLMDKNYKNSYLLIFKPEYINSLKRNFTQLFKNEEKDKYLKKILMIFSDELKNKVKEKEYLKYDYGRFLCFIKNDEFFKKKYKKLFENLDIKIFEKCDVRPEIGPVITYRKRIDEIETSKINQDYFINLNIEDLVKNLKTKWSVKSFYDNKSQIDPQEIEFLLKKRIEVKFEEMLQNALLFFDEQIHPRYLYAFLQGIKENLSKNESKDFLPLFNLFEKIKEKGRNWFINQDKKIKNVTNFGWQANWRSVHYIMVDILKEMLKSKDDKPLINFEAYKNHIFKILEYLLDPDLGYPDPSKDDDSRNSEKFKYEGRRSNPFMIAINSVRGRAFEVLIFYVFWEHRKELSDNVKSLLEKLVLKEESRSMMFMYGYYTYRFYYKDRDWFVEKILPVIFKNKNKKDKYLILATKEGYLSQALYREIFLDKAFKEIYKDWINDDLVDYPNQEHFKNPDEGLADHLALGFVFDLDFDFNSNLFRIFFKKKNKKRWKEFIRFIGIILQNEKNYPEFPNNLEKKLFKLWDFILGKEELNCPDVLSAFGEWLDEKINIFSDKNKLVNLVLKTLVKSKGAWDNEYALLERISDFSKASLKNTLHIIKNFFVVEYNQEEQNQRKLMAYYQTHQEKIKAIFREALSDKKLEYEAKKLLIFYLINYQIHFGF